MVLRHAARGDPFRTLSPTYSRLCGCRQPFHPHWQPRPRMSRSALRPYQNPGTKKSSIEKPVLLFDMMDTIVWDPFYTELPQFFDMDFKEVLKEKDPLAWPEFEKGMIAEEELYERFFRDRRSIDGLGLAQHMMNGYRYMDGMEMLLLDLKRQDVEMHVISNYPVWYKRIEAKLGVSRHLPWTFISCEGPMKGLRKPDPESFQVVCDTLGKQPEQLMLIDDRQANVIGALEAGWNALQYRNTPALRRDLEQKRILDGQTRIDPG